MSIEKKLKFITFHIYIVSLKSLTTLLCLPQFQPLSSINFYKKFFSPCYIGLFLMLIK